MMRNAAKASWRGPVVWAAIVLFSACLGTIVDWQAPGLALYSHDWLVRARGPLPVPQDIRIVAIDEPSLRRFGRFPWPRTLFARLIQNLSKAQTRAILLDVLFVDPSSETDDAQLNASIQDAGNIVSAAQLRRTENGAVVWLRPLPAIERASAATGHVEVSTEVNGVAESFLVQKADDNGATYWAMPIQAVQIGEGTATHSLEALPRMIHFGTHTFPVQMDTRTIELGSGRLRSLKHLQGGWIPIEYVGPAGSFSPTTYSIADVIDGKVPLSSFRDKYVIVGATAAGLGEEFTSPFVHGVGPVGEQHGEGMSGTEVLANSLNTLLRNRAYSETPDAVGAMAALLVALLTIGLFSAAQGKHELLAQGMLLVLVPMGIVGAGYWVFSHWLINPPLVPLIVSFAAAAPLTFLRRNLEASRDLDHRIDDLTEAQGPLLKENLETSSNPASLIAQLTHARFAAILMKAERSGYWLVSSSTALRSPEPARKLSAIDFSGERLKHEHPATVKLPRLLRLFHGFSGESAEETAALVWPLQASSGFEGALVVVPLRDEPIPPERVRLALEIARSYLLPREGGYSKDWESHPTGIRENRFLPRGIRWKTRALGNLQRRLLQESQFIERSLRSVGDGLLVAVPTGEIVFANLRAAEILGLPEPALSGSKLFDRLGINDTSAIAALESLLVDRVLVEREFRLGEGKPRYFNLRMNVVTEPPEPRGRVLGIVVSISDITKQQELQQLKSDVLSLVTHEMRTPLTAIQGMSEVLAEFDLDPERRKEMHQAINEEAKRLARMIEEYLDITRLEAGARPLRRESLRIEKVVERALLLLEPVAQRRGIQVERHIDPNLPSVLADEDLVSRAITNVVGNAVKFSRPGDAIRIRVVADPGDVAIAVEDTGPGIAESDLPHIFEKFYRAQHPGAALESGSGLGLAYVKEIMEAHGGCVTVESGIGAGSKFILRLPRVIPPRLAD